MCNGTTMQAINNENIKKINIIVPEFTVLNDFQKLVKPIFKMYYYNTLEIEKLSILRDKLLPKLMSGEIDISKLDI